KASLIGEVRAKDESKEVRAKRQAENRARSYPLPLCPYLLPLCGRLASDCPADASQVMPRMSQRVVLDDKLRRHRSSIAQREWSCTIQFLISECAYRIGRLVTVATQQLDSLGLRCICIVLSVYTIDLRNHIPGHISNGST